MSEEKTKGKFARGQTPAYELGMTNGAGRTVRTVTTLECKHCGRKWQIGSTATGFVQSAYAVHVENCESRTPAQRRANNARAEKQWEKVGTAAKIWNNPDHTGLKDKAPWKPPRWFETETAMNIRAGHAMKHTGPEYTYMGRAMPRQKLVGSIWANPFPLPRNATPEQRADCLNKYGHYVLENPDLKARLERGELIGTTGTCWCYGEITGPEPPEVPHCHIDVLRTLQASLYKPEGTQNAGAI